MSPIEACMDTPVHVSGSIPQNPPLISDRDLSHLAADQAALRALVQAAVNVELFTVPIYMCAMKSIQGTHAINAKDISYYQGRVWPGRSIGQIPAAPPVELANQTAYNLLFSVFIDEMLHLQMAANLCSALGVKPNFNSPALQDEQYNWICYGPDKTVIPHIIDLRDLKPNPVNPVPAAVDLTALTPSQTALFEIIEQDHATALASIKPSTGYFPTVPFDGWTAQSTEVDLPMFGTIGWMYYCLLQYTNIAYTDGQTLWEKCFAGALGQRDLFNSKSSGHPMAEYPGMPSQITFTGALDAHIQAMLMMWAICDQGEGGIDWDTIQAFIGKVQQRANQRRMALAAANANVLVQFQPSQPALEADYPSYSDTGTREPHSDDATARVPNGTLNHFERFHKIAEQLGSLRTWQHWHQAGNSWSASMLTTADYDPAKAPTNIPTPEAVAAALNELKTGMPSATLDNVVQGALAGITTVLSSSWGDTTVPFPFPSMVGSGDRMALYWAVYGSAPSLREASAASGTGTQGEALMHACQSLALDGSGGDCAAQAVYHSCKGSNHCATQGGCGFVQSVNGGGNCSQSAGSAGSCGHPSTMASGKGGCGAPTLYSAPADNRCNGFGGCAVPISASQLYPSSGTMQLFDFKADGTPEPLTSTEGDATVIVTLDFAVGDSVYDVAWGALEKVWAHRNPGQPAPAKPLPTTLRIALPPST
ncbi:ferritin-like protein [Burkholderia gladioli]|uniref:ferritin-like protein n=1 Tax=Burkholderia gladioli TaxID=28095 RepID=UPI001FC80233|nr:ferritin-like protein [Burkholderia gladioli]